MEDADCRQPVKLRSIRYWKIMAQAERPVTKPADEKQGGTKDGITDIACNSGNSSGMAD